MSKKKISKEELKSDAFLSAADQISKYLSDNWKPFALLVGLVLAGGVGMTAMDMVNRSKEMTAKEDLFRVEKKVGAIETAFQKEQEAALEKAKDKEKAEKALPEKPEFAKYQPILGEWSSVIAQYDGTKSSHISRVKLAQLYMTYDMYDKAKEALSTVVDNSKKGTAIYGLSRMQMASILSHLNQADSGLSLLTEVLADPGLKFLHGEALIKTGVFQKKKGDIQAAKETFLRLSTEFGETESGKLAKNYLRYLDLTEAKGQDVK